MPCCAMNHRCINTKYPVKFIAKPLFMEKKNTQTYLNPIDARSFCKLTSLCAQSDGSAVRLATNRAADFFPRISCSENDLQRPLHGLVEIACTKDTSTSEGARNDSSCIGDEMSTWSPEVLKHSSALNK